MNQNEIIKSEPNSQNTLSFGDNRPGNWQNIDKNEVWDSFLNMHIRDIFNGIW